MGQIESKVFVNAPPWTTSRLKCRTDLDQNTIDVCWSVWTRSKLVRHNKLDLKSFIELMDIETEEERREAVKLFELLDHNEDEGIEFNAIIACLFALDKELSREQVLRRSFHLYDRNASGKITRTEMVDALVNLEVIDITRDDKGKVVIPADVENLFSLMDFQHDGKIDESDFMRCTSHYRRLANMLSLDMLEHKRKMFIDKIQEWKDDKLLDHHQTSSQLHPN